MSIAHPSVTHRPAARPEREAAALWLVTKRMGVELLARSSPAPCSAVHDAPCDAGDPRVVYRYRVVENGWTDFMRDPRRTFCPCGRTEYYEHS